MGSKTIRKKHGRYGKKQRRYTRRKEKGGTRGGGFVAAGSYGCIYRPALHCDHERLSAAEQKVPRVSKLMTYHSAYIERKEYKRMDKIDPKHEYHLPAPTICNPSQDHVTEWKECPLKAVQRYVADVMRESKNLTEGILPDDVHPSDKLADKLVDKLVDKLAVVNRSAKSHKPYVATERRAKGGAEKSYNDVALSASPAETPDSYGFTEASAAPDSSEARAALKLLVMEDGGDDLKQGQAAFRKWTAAEIAPFLVECRQLLRGIADVGDKGYVMGDIKPNNILYKLEGKDSTGKKLNFIDFGTLCNKHKFLHHIKSMQISFFHNFPLESYYARDEKAYADKTVGMSEVRPYLRKKYKQVVVHILENSPSPMREETLQADFEQMIARAANEGVTHDAFYKEAGDKFDVYQLGLVMMYLLRLFEDALREKHAAQFDDLFRLCYRMMTPNMFERATAKEAESEYAAIVAKF